MQVILSAKEVEQLLLKHFRVDNYVVNTVRLEGKVAETRFSNGETCIISAKIELLPTKS